MCFSWRLSSDVLLHCVPHSRHTTGPLLVMGTELAGDFLFLRFFFGSPAPAAGVVSVEAVVAEGAGTEVTAEATDGVTEAVCGVCCWCSCATL